MPPKPLAVWLFAILPAVSPLRAEEPNRTVVALWPQGAPGFEDRRDEPEQAQDYWVRNIHQPSLTVFLPPAEKATGTAVIICPGGGHRELVFQAEGVAPARYLNSLGVAAFVLKYRLGREPGSPYSIETHARADGQRAVRLVRSRAAEWRLDPARIGMLGFSAGAEVVAMVAYGPGDGEPTAIDPIDRASCRPDFQIIIYPGPIGIPDTLPADAPPAFFLVALDDEDHVAPVLRQLALYRAAHLSVEVHLFAAGGHGFNLGDRSPMLAIQHWPQRMADWMLDRGLLRPVLRP